MKGMRKLIREWLQDVPKDTIWILIVVLIMVLIGCLILGHKYDTRNFERKNFYERKGL